MSEEPDCSFSLSLFKVANTFVCMRLSLFASQMAPPIRGGWVGATKNTSTGGAQGPASRNVPVASTGTALTPSTTATVMRTINSGRSNSSPAKQNNEFQIEVVS